MMTPGLRDFVIDMPAGDDSAQDLLAAALVTLSRSFMVLPEPAAAGTHRRTWLDTFDWRLYRAGLMLQFEHAKRGGRLLLSKADGTLQAEQPVTSWPRRPRLAEDLPEGPVRDRIIVLTRPRALLPIVRAVSAVSVARLLNADGKTVVRLVADRTTVTAPSALSSAAAAGTTAELPPRLAVTAVRGYPGQARRAASLLAAAPGISYASQSVFTAALTALGRHPADYTSGVEAEITATMPGSVAVARLLLRLLDTLELNVDGVLRDIDTEFLHDLRVAVRRTRSAIKLLGGVLPARLAEHYKAEFKWLGDLTTPTRDLDVHLLGFGPMTGQLVAASPADLEPLRAFLVKRRAREFRRLATALRGPRFRAITDDWRKALLEIRDAGGPRRTASRRGRPGRHHDRARIPAARRARRRDHPGLAPGVATRPAQTRQGTTLPAGVLRAAARPGRVPQGGRRPQVAAGLPRRFPGQPGPARGDSRIGRRDAGRACRPGRYAAGHG